MEDKSDWESPFMKYSKRNIFSITIYEDTSKYNFNLNRGNLLLYFTLRGGQTLTKSAQAKLMDYYFFNDFFLDLFGKLNQVYENAS